MKIIGITGLAGSGKGSIADHLCTTHGYQKLSFADTLKDIVATTFGWERHLLEGDTRESREWREKVDPFWASRLKDDRFSPRKALRMIGTDVMRDHFNSNIWVYALERKIRDYDKVVIPDVRFENELNVIKEHKGKIIRVQRGELPEWFKVVESFQESGMETMHVAGVHKSETEWIGRDLPDLIIQNDGTLDDLYMMIDNFVGVG